ncbi:MAG: HAD-IA family hydrolase, partial [Ignavibacteriaceae bacterium]|nr:HAD-IA family hydrolase [Ignavibacteriaceae bacterium]
LYKRIGHHFVDIFSELNINVEDFEHFIIIYKSFYFDYINLSVLYPDTQNLIKTLNKRNILVSLLTTKGQDQAEKILKYFDLAPRFNYIMGRREGIKTKPSPEPLQKICFDLGIKPADTLMVGDTELDIQCGQTAGAFTCAVSHGYRTVEQLQFEKPDFIVNNIKELMTLL